MTTLVQVSNSRLLSSVKKAITPSVLWDIIDRPHTVQLHNAWSIFSELQQKWTPRSASLDSFTSACAHREHAQGNCTDGIPPCILVIALVWFHAVKNCIPASDTRNHISAYPHAMAPMQRTTQHGICGAKSKVFGLMAWEIAKEFSHSPGFGPQTPYNDIRAKYIYNAQHSHWFEGLDYST